MEMRTRMQRSGLALALAACAPALLLGRARAEHFDVALRVRAGDTQGQAFMDTTPPLGGINTRPIVKAKPGQEISVSWMMKSDYPHGTMKNVTVHFFVVREDKIGQKPVPDPSTRAGVVDNSFTMDFAPAAAATGSIRFTIADPGSYLVRVQSENTHQEHGHEHFSAVDLLIQP